MNGLLNARSTGLKQRKSIPFEEGGCLLSFPPAKQALFEGSDPLHLTAGKYNA